MTLVWLIIWIIGGARFHGFLDPNAWAISLACCAFLDVVFVRNVE